MQNLRISLVQGATRWHDPDGNREYYGGLIAPLHGITDVILLPETFTSGFSNDAIASAETMDGPTVAWIRAQAQQLGAVVTGSVQLREGDNVYNRLLWATPDGGLQHYDKRHLFRYAREHERYAAGRERLIVECKGWRINPLVCYDLRFPVYARNRYDATRPGGLDFDLQFYVANWPSARAYAWKTLLRARAIENLCYLIAPDQGGTHPGGRETWGDSLIVDPWGQVPKRLPSGPGVVLGEIDLARLRQTRERFPVLQHRRLTP